MRHKPDPHHPLAHTLPRFSVKEAAERSATTRMALLHAAQMKRAYSAVAARALADPHPSLTPVGREALADIHRKLTTIRGYRPTLKQLALLDTADWHRPCAERGCGKLAHFQFKALGWCREHEAAYWHARRVWASFARVEQKQEDRVARTTEYEAVERAHIRAARGAFRRKKRNK